MKGHRKLYIDIMNTKIQLRDKRIEAGYTIEEVAEIMNVSRQTVSKWESLKSNIIPMLHHYVSLASIYNVTLDELTATEERNK